MISINGDGFPPQQIFQVDVPHVRQDLLPFSQRRERRQNQRAHSRADAQRRNPLADRERRGGQRNNGVFDLKRFRPPRQLADRPPYFITMHFAALLIRRIVQQPGQAPFAGTHKFARQVGPRSARAQHKHRRALRAQPTITMEFFRGTVERARAAQQQQQKKRRQNPYRARYRRRRLEQSGANDHQQGTGEDRFAQPQQVRQTGENPHAPIQAKDAEDKTMQWQYPEQMPLRALPEFRRNLAVKTGYVGKQQTAATAPRSKMQTMNESQAAR